MQTNRTKTLVGGLLGLSAAFSIASPVLAAPRDREVRQERRDVKEARKEVKQERRDVRKADTKQERRQEKREYKDARQDLREERQELRGERRENRNDNRPNYNGNYNRPNYNNGQVWNRPNYGNYRPNYGNTANQGQTGVVTNVRGSQLFDVRIGNKVFNVYTVSGLPRGLSNGDVVRVSGSFVGSNDIRNARVSLINNR